MIPDLIKQADYRIENPVFSILIPTWNNLEFLRLCIDSIRNNSAFTHQIIVIINEGTDGTIEWISQQNLDYILYHKNAGICHALNNARPLVRADYICYINDDMYLLPKWDKVLQDEITKLGHSDFLLSSTMIEPVNTGNKCVIIGDFGSDPYNFNEAELIENHEQLSIPDWSGSTWPPVVLSIELWDSVSGLSLEFSPGMYSDPDLSMKLWMKGIRYFKGMGKSHCYHFGSKSTKRIKRNNGHKTFIKKWGVSSSVFTSRYLRQGEPFVGELMNPKFTLSEKLVFFVKRLLTF
jgi:glycosyltransferase involved in cell wall biosynthesis